jgi:hypothetical protein
MDNSTPKRTRFGFGQFRFIIAAVLLLAAGLKAYQLATAPLPPPVHGSIFTPLLELLNNRGLLLFVVEVEILFALVLFSGIQQQWTWLISLLCFTTFSAISIMKGLSGESSCGCFGVVMVNPWFTASFDIIIVILLAFFREPFELNFRLSMLDRKKLTTVLIVWCFLAVPLLFAMLSLKQVHATLGTEFTDYDGTQAIQLEPENWIGKEFPLASRFVQPVDDEILKQGDWTILLIHADCSRCLQLLSEMNGQSDKNTAIIEIPSGKNLASPKTDLPYFKLDENNKWFATTPFIIKLSDWICVSAKEP